MLLAKGWRVGLAARREEPLALLCRQFPGQAEVCSIDVTAEDAEERLLSLVGKVGGVDLYFHASGIGWQNMSLEPSAELATVSTNALGFTRMVGVAYRYMAVHGGGHIAVISSIAGTRGLGAAPAYSATKAFQNTYIQALEQQARMRGLAIRFTDIRPGFVATPLLGERPRYPMLMGVEQASREIFRTVMRREHVRVVDWRYRWLVRLWRRVPRWLWRRLKVR